MENAQFDAAELRGREGCVWWPTLVILCATLWSEDSVACGRGFRGFEFAFSIFEPPGFLSPSGRIVFCRSQVSCTWCARSSVRPTARLAPGPQVPVKECNSFEEGRGECTASLGSLIPRIHVSSRPSVERTASGRPRFARQPLQKWLYCLTEQARGVRSLMNGEH